MNYKIKLNENTKVDLAKLIDSRLLVQANSGGGKSWLLRRILEQSHGKVQQIIIDLEGEFSSLREKHDYILAGKGGDVPAESKTAALLARKLLELGVSAIIDLYELPHYERKHFVKLFLESMINAPKNLWHSCLVVVDEAHIFAPEKGQSEAMESVIDLATRGRKRGYCAVLATQRLSKLHKDAAAECNNKLIGRTGLDIDMKRATEELGFTSKDQYLSLRNLLPGEFFAYGPAISKEVIQITVGGVKTSHPEAGSRIMTKITPPTEKIKNVLKKLTDLPQEAKKEMNTIVDFQNEIANLRRQLRIAGQNKNVSPEAITRAVAEALKKKQGEINKFIEGHKRNVIFVEQAYKSLKQIERIAGSIKKLEQPKISIREIQMRYSTTLKRPVVKELLISNMKLPSQKATDKFFGGGHDHQEKEKKPIQGGALRMLKVLVSRYPVKLSKAQLGTFSKLKPRGGTFSTYLSTLKGEGFIESDGKLFMATEAGIDFLGEEPNPPQTSEEVIELWRDNLTGGARRMFNLLIEAYPQGYLKEQLGEMAGVVHTGGSFGTYMSILRSNNLVEISNGEIKASDHLFDL